MRKQLYWLSDAEWKRIEPLMPRGRRGAHRVDDRRIISGIVHMLRSGTRWRDCPPDYVPYTTVYNRFNRWSRQGIWNRHLLHVDGLNRHGRDDVDRLNAHQGSLLRRWRKRRPSTTRSAARAVGARPKSTR